MAENNGVKSIFTVLKRHYIAIVLCTFMGLVVGGIWAVSTSTTPSYLAQAQLLVSFPERTNSDTDTDTITDQNMSTFKDLLMSRSVLDSVKSRLKSDYGLTVASDKIKDSLTINQTDKSRVLTLQVAGTSELLAEKTATSMIKASKIASKDIISSSKIITVSKVTTVNNTVIPSKREKIVNGVCFGFILGVGLAFLLSFMDPTIKSPQFITEAVPYPLLGRVSN